MNLDAESGLATALLQQITRMPQAFGAGWQAGLTAALPGAAPLERIILAGMGDAGLAADLLAAYAQPVARLPLTVQHDYGLPGWAQSAGSLVVLLSAVEDGEEARSWLENMRGSGASTLLIAPPGGLREQGSAAGVLCWPLERENVLAGGFGRLLALAARLGVMADPTAEVENALDALRAQQRSLAPDVPVVRNPAKREAGQVMGRLLVLYASDHLVPVARHWKNQVNRLANAAAFVETLPDANHNALEGILNPEDALERVLIMFLRAQSCHPRNSARADLTRRGYMVAGLNTDTYDAAGETRLAQMLTALHFGDYLAVYLGTDYRADPAARQISASFARALDAWRDDL